jgi:hypothetical protein
LPASCGAFAGFSGEAAVAGGGTAAACSAQPAGACRLSSAGSSARLGGGFEGLQRKNAQPELPEAC